MVNRPAPNEWDLCKMPAARKAALERVLSIDELAVLISADARLNVPRVEEADNRAAPPNTLRACYRVNVSVDVGDVFYNGIAGLRAHYWSAPNLGDEVTSAIVRFLKNKLLALSGNVSLHSRKGGVMTRENLACALELPSAKVWIDESQLRSAGSDLDVERWKRNEGEPGNPRLWQFTPRATVIDVKTGWLTGGREEWVPEGKRERAMQIHRWGFS